MSKSKEKDFFRKFNITLNLIEICSIIMVLFFVCNNISEGCITQKELWLSERTTAYFKKTI